MEGNDEVLDLQQGIGHRDGSLKDSHGIPADEKIGAINVRGTNKTLHLKGNVGGDSKSDIGKGSDLLSATIRTNLLDVAIVGLLRCDKLGIDSAV